MGNKMCLEDWLREADKILDEVIVVLGMFLLAFMAVGFVIGVFRIFFGV